MGVSKPYFWKPRNAWFVYVYVDGKRTRRKLADTKTEAFDRWKAMLKTDAQLRVDPLFSTIATQWLEVQLNRYKAGKVGKLWLNRVTRTIKSFTTKNELVSCSQITHAFLDAIAADIESSSYARTELSVIRSVMRWAAGEGNKISKDYSEGYSLPAEKIRDKVISLEEYNCLCRNSSRSLKMIVRMAWLTGARPVELRELKWSHVTSDLSKAVMQEHKTAKKTKKPRVIYFSARAATILKILKRESKSKYVFVNNAGTQWTKDALARAITRACERGKIDLVAYNFRHTWITRALQSEVPIATVVELIGHTDPTMIIKTYGHLDQSKKYLSSAIEKVK